MYLSGSVRTLNATNKDINKVCFVTTRRNVGEREGREGGGERGGGGGGKGFNERENTISLVEGNGCWRCSLELGRCNGWRCSGCCCYLTSSDFYSDTCILSEGGSVRIE